MEHGPVRPTPPASATAVFFWAARFGRLSSDMSSINHTMDITTGTRHLIRQLPDKKSRHF